MNFKSNRALVVRLESFAAGKGHTAAQIALAWLLAQGAGMAPIPGTKHRAWLVCADAVDRADTVIGYGDRGDGALAITRRG